MSLEPRVLRALPPGTSPNQHRVFAQGRHACEAGVDEAGGGSLRMREESEGGVLSPHPPFPPLAVSRSPSASAASPGLRGETGELTSETTLRRQLFRP